MREVFPPPPTPSTASADVGEGNRKLRYRGHPEGLVGGQGVSPGWCRKAEIRCGGGRRELTSSLWTVSQSQALGQP